LLSWVSWGGRLRSNPPDRPRARWAPSGRARRLPSPGRGEGGKSPRRKASSGATGREASSSGTRLPPPLPPHRRRSWPHDRDSGKPGGNRSYSRPSAPRGPTSLLFLCRCGTSQRACGAVITPVRSERRVDEGRGRGSHDAFYLIWLVHGGFWVKK